MVLLTLVGGKKGPDDILVLVTAYNQPLTFAEWLFIGKCYFDSEASVYPIQEGYIGKAMLMNALNELSHGVDFEKVLKRYKLKRKGKGLKIIDKRKARFSLERCDMHRGGMVKEA
ncbi:MAG: hypothetical protein ACFFCW_50025 [Candidatus Hodarchaeota archaeon]